MAMEIPLQFWQIHSNPVPALAARTPLSMVVLAPADRPTGLPNPFTIHDPERDVEVALKVSAPLTEPFLVLVQAAKERADAHGRPPTGPIVAPVDGLLPASIVELPQVVQLTQLVPQDLVRELGTDETLRDLDVAPASIDRQLPRVAHHGLVPPLPPASA